MSPGDRLRAVEKARSALLHGAFLLHEPPFTIEKVAEAIICAAIALVQLASADPESKAKDLAFTAVRLEAERRGFSASTSSDSAPEE